MLWVAIRGGGCRSTGPAERLGRAVGRHAKTGLNASRRRPSQSTSMTISDATVRIALASAGMSWSAVIRVMAERTFGAWSAALRRGIHPFRARESLFTYWLTRQAPCQQPPRTARSPRGPIRHPLYPGHQSPPDRESARVSGPGVFRGCLVYLSSTTVSVVGAAGWEKEQ